MIYFTGDIHGDAERLSKIQLSMCSAGDTLIICGDFGFIWNNDMRENSMLNRLAKRKYNICFVDGIHENFSLLDKYPVVMWHGGKVHKIRRNIFHLMRGQVFEIEKKTIFTMGGGENPDAELTDEELPQRNDEVPSAQEMLSGVANMERHNYKVDFIVTHEPPAKIRDFLMLSENVSVRATALGAYLDELSQQAEYKRWFFGSMHRDKFISASMTSLFKNIIKADPAPEDKTARG